MELVYLWVEDYKNIKKQGFNFSPNFECEFFPIYEKYTDENGEEKEKLKDNCELKIIPKENPLKDFFGGNINVTAIVGENGSGKSSLSKFISNFYDNYNIYHSINGFNPDKFVVLFISKTNEKFILSNSNIKRIYPKYSLNSFEDKNFFSGVLDVNRDNINNEINKNSFLKNFFKYVRISLKCFTNDNESNLLFNLGLESHLLSDDEIIRIKKLYSNGYERFLCLILFNKITNTIDSKKIKNIQNVKEELEKLKIYIPSKEEYEYFTTNIIEIDSLDTLAINKYKDYFDFYFLNEEKVFIDEYSNGEFVKFYLKLVLNQYGKYYKERITLIFDEVENSLHPNWQKSYINETIQTIKEFEGSYHLIFITHSPFLLSDLPKQNIIFLEKDEKTGKCINSSNKVKMNTFGANIQTLLSHGFFMKDGLMGEFAKSKIQSIIKYHENIEKKEIIEADKIEYKTKKQKEFWQIQSIIGDDYLKQVIKNHLIEIEKIVLGNDEAKEEEIKRLKAQIELLEK